MVETRVDIIFATLMVNYFAKNPELDHFNAVYQILRYLADSLERNIIFERKSELNLVRYSDSDWARDYSDRKSVLGFVFTLNRKLISYGLKKQVVVALSSIKTKYVTFSLATQKVTWLWLLLIKLGLLKPDQQFVEIRVHESNKCVDRTFTLAKKYQRPDNGRETSCRQKNLLKIWEIPHLSNIIYFSSTSITFKSNNQSLIVLANNPVLYMHIKHIDI